MNVVLCEYAEKRSYTAGNKARTDTMNILRDEGYKHIPLFRSKNKKIIILFQMGIGTIRTIFSAGMNDIVFLQYPYYPSVVNTVLFAVLKLGRKIKKYKIALLIHDVVGLRTENSEKIRKEVSSFNDMDYVISHNDHMTKALKEHGGKDNYLTLGPFDYLYSGDAVNAALSDGYRVVIAGNLSVEKCKYIYDLNSINGVDFNLYGINYSGESNAHVTYKGQFPPEELIRNLEGHFGLVWDGDSIETCSGGYGNYLKYNNPHKFSLYIAAGIPLIVWSESALSDYVRSKNIGICVCSLKELESTLSSLSPEEYHKMRANTMILRNEIITGGHLRAVISNLSIQTSETDH